MFTPTTHIVSCNFDLDEYWDNFARMIEGRLIQIVKAQEIIAHDEQKSHLELIASLMDWIPKGFKDDFNEGKSNAIDLVNYSVSEYFGNEPYGEILDIIEEGFEISTLKAIVKLSDGTSVYVKLEFRLP